MVSMKILATLFGSSERVRIMRYAIVRQSEKYDVQSVSSDLQIDSITVRRELKILTKIGFLQECVYTKAIIKSKKKDTKVQKEKTKGYKLVTTFQYLSSFKTMLLDKEELAPAEIYEHFKKLGKIQLFLTAGFFCGEKSTGDVDLVIVGTSLKKLKIEEKISEIESFIGTEITYALFDTEDFMYRYMMHDKFVREILHRKHHSVVNSLILK